MTIVDAHLHVWDVESAAHPWLTAEHHPIDRTIRIDEVLPSLERAGVSGAVLVQSADNNEDTDHLLAVAAEHPDIVLGVVAFVPLDQPREAERRLRALSRMPIVVGVRNLIHDQADPDHLLRPEVDAGLSLLEDFGLPFDVVTSRPRHLEHVPTVARRHPRLRLVLDHLGKPPIGEPAADPWWTAIERCAELPTVFTKVSGLYPQSSPVGWTPDSIRPFVERALDVFGADRVMYGGDWPMSELAGGYDRVWDGLSTVLQALSTEDRERVLGGTAIEFYGLRLPEVSTADQWRRL